MIWLSGVNHSLLKADISTLRIAGLRGSLLVVNLAKKRRSI
jgi:hypothetical protein